MGSEMCIRDSPSTGSATTRNTGACSHGLSRRSSAAVAIVLRFVTPGMWLICRWGSALLNEPEGVAIDVRRPGCGICGLAGIVVTDLQPAVGGAGVIDWVIQMVRVQLLNLPPPPDLLVPMTQLASVPTWTRTPMRSRRATPTSRSPRCRPGYAGIAPMPTGNPGPGCSGGRRSHADERPGSDCPPARDLQQEP